MIMKKTEQGQIIVILALAMVAILGITALAIDGSLIYNARRQDQNTADSAALAGAGAAANYLKEVGSGELICGKPEGTQATLLAIKAIHDSVAVDGISAAEMPKLTNDTELAAADQGFTITCKWYGGLGIQYLDFHVKVSTEMDTSFARVVGQNTLKTSVESTARVYPTQPFAYGNGLVSLSDLCSTKQGGIEFLGTSETVINSGGVFSNSCLKMNTGLVNVTGGSIQYWHESECKDCFSNPKVSPEPVPAYTKLPKDMIRPPECPAKTPANTNSAKKGEYQDVAGVGIFPGWYTTGIQVPNGKTLTLNPGLYCIEGDMTNNSGTTLIAKGVTLYFLDGDLTLNQNDDGKVELISCPLEPCYTAPTSPDWAAVKGLLMYFDPSYQAVIKMNGGSTNSFKGTIFGSNANFTLNGNTETTSGESFAFSTQIVGNWIEVAGKADLLMNLNASDFVSMPPSISLVK